MAASYANNVCQLAGCLSLSPSGKETNKRVKADQQQASYLTNVIISPCRPNARSTLQQQHQLERGFHLLADK